MKNSVAPGIVIASIMLLGACNQTSSKPEGPAEAATPTSAAAPGPEDVKAAVEIFSTRCTPCHGPAGAGDGPASAGLVPKPANFSSQEWQTKVTDDHIEKIIVYGGTAVGKSAAMPPNPDLDAKPALVKALRAHVRGLKK